MTIFKRNPFCLLLQCLIYYTVFFRTFNVSYKKIHQSVCQTTDACKLETLTRTEIELRANWACNIFVMGNKKSIDNEKYIFFIVGKKY